MAYFPTRTGEPYRNPAIRKHIRPTIGRLQVGRVKAETIDGLYAQLRRCRDHCHGAKYIQHCTDRPSSTRAAGRGRPSTNLPTA